MRSPLTWLRPLSLSRRIAVAMVLSLVAVQVQAFVQVWLSSNPEIRLTGTRWLAATVRDAVQDAMALPTEARVARLRERSRGLPVHLHWDRSRPWPPVPDDPLAIRLTATLREMLGADAATVQVAPTRLLYMFPVDSLRVAIAPGSVREQLGRAPVRAGEPEVLIPVSLRIAVQCGDGSWVSADPIGFDDGQAFPLVPLTALLAGAAIVTVVSITVARRIVGPLERLVDAAETVGTSREPVTISIEGLGEFAAVARAFEDMQRRLIRFVSDRTQMLAAISHDLRSALTRMAIAVEGDGDQVAILAEVRDMSTMLDSTLAFATGEAEATPRQSVDIAALLISLTDDFADAGRSCSYAGPDHCVGAGDPVSLKRAFANLMDNAIKYGSTARVRLETFPALLRVTVTDDGPGIPAEQVEEAFRPFRRLDRARSGHPGAGLGLTIARDVVSSHGGTIRLRSGEERGLGVIVELPVSGTDLKKRAFD